MVPTPAATKKSSCRTSVEHGGPDDGGRGAGEKPHEALLARDAEQRVKHVLVVAPLVHRQSTVRLSPPPRPRAYVHRRVSAAAHTGWGGREADGLVGEVQAAGQTQLRRRLWCRSRKRKTCRSEARLLRSPTLARTCMRMSVRSAGLPTSAPIAPALKPATNECHTGLASPGLSVLSSFSDRMPNSPMRAVVYVACGRIAASLSNASGTLARLAVWLCDLLGHYPTVIGTRCPYGPLLKSVDSCALFATLNRLHPQRVVLLHAAAKTLVQPAKPATRAIGMLPHVET